MIFHITSNADEELRGRGIQARKISSSITRVLARWRGEREMMHAGRRGDEGRGEVRGGEG